MSSHWWCVWNCCWHYWKTHSCFIYYNRSRLSVLIRGDEPWRWKWLHLFTLQETMMVATGDRSKMNHKKMQKKEKVDGLKYSDRVLTTWGGAQREEVSSSLISSGDLGVSSMAFTSLIDITCRWLKSVAIWLLCNMLCQALSLWLPVLGNFRSLNSTFRVPVVSDTK